MAAVISFGSGNPAPTGSWLTGGTTSAILGYCRDGERALDALNPFLADVRDATRPQALSSSRPATAPHSFFAGVAAAGPIRFAIMMPEAFRRTSNESMPGV
jgi:hypothetical protein